MTRNTGAPFALPHSHPVIDSLRGWTHIILLWAATLLGACGRAEYEPAVQSASVERSHASEGWAATPSPPAPAPLMADAVPQAAAPADGATSAVDGADTVSTSVGGAPSATQNARIEHLIYNAFLRVAVADPEAAATKLADWARAQGGYVLAQRGQTLELRVPSKRFSESVTTAAEAGELLDRRIQVQDVTEQYFDLETRIANAEALQARLRGLLERSQVVKDALAIERELARVSAELEVLKGKMRRLRELTTYSTITIEWVKLEADELQTTARLPFPWLGTLGLSHLLDMEDQ